LINTYNENFSTEISEKNIIDTFCGLRVLPENNVSTFKKSRDSLIVESKSCPGLIALIGGKLTVYRASAERVISKISTDKKRLRNNTRKIKLSID